MSYLPCAVCDNPAGPDGFCSEECKKKKEDARALLQMEADLPIKRCPFCQEILPWHGIGCVVGVQ